jgi:hypothetical protein
MLPRMKSALALILGVAMLSLAAGCSSSDDNSGSGGKGPVVVGGSGSGGSVVPTGGTGGGTLPDGVPLTPADGWVAKDSNTLGVQGAMFEYADTTSIMSLMKDFTGSNACIKGEAAAVMDPCTIVPPATDCYGTYWGAAVGLNMNQPIDEATGEGAEAMPYDATAIKGFAFTITGSTIPGVANLRFKIEGPGADEYCTPASKGVKQGDNVFMFADLVKECWSVKAGAATAETVHSKVVKIAWQVVTKKGGTVPYDFCVSNLRALTN